MTTLRKCGGVWRCTLDRVWQFSVCVCEGEGGGTEREFGRPGLGIIHLEERVVSSGIRIQCSHMAG